MHTYRKVNKSFQEVFAVGYWLTVNGENVFTVLSHHERESEAIYRVCKLNGGGNVHGW